MLSRGDRWFGANPIPSDTELRFSVPLRCAFALALCLVAACANIGPARVLVFPDSGIRPAASVNRIRSYDSAAASVLFVIEHDLGFDSFPIAFQFCPDAAAFEATLLESGYDRKLARDTAGTMQAIGGYRRILINESALQDQPWPSRVAMLAHEVGHSLQYEWGGGQRGASDQWLREGFAEWLALQVLERLQGTRASAMRSHYVDLLQSKTPSPRDAPSLEEMVTFRQWVALGQRPNSTQYAQAFLSVDFLIARHGVPAVVAYFRRFARSSDRSTNFREAFGEDLRTFGAAAALQLWK